MILSVFTCRREANCWPVDDITESTTRTEIDYEEVHVPGLVIGAGAAGARLVIELRQHDTEPLVIGKRDYGDAHTTWAAGGINAALGSRDAEDRWAIHAADTLREGHFLNNPEAVELVTREMPDRIRELDEWGMDFARTEDGAIQQRYFGAQSFRRTCFVGDRTGEAMLETLVDKAQSLSIPYRENIMITRLLSDGDRISGAVGFDMEFVQFHPTGMVGERYADDWDGRLVTEAIRGEGGRLYNEEGVRFMKRYSPDQMELDARDVVARAIAQEIREGRGTEHGGVYLDISHRDSDEIRERPPSMVDRFESLGVDITSEPMEVAPTAHYTMGGVDIDPYTGETGVEGLYAVGESTAGVHGANRLGGNSLAETVAVAKPVGQHIADQIHSSAVATDGGGVDMVTSGDTDATLSLRMRTRAEQEFQALTELEAADGETTPEQLLDDLGELLWTHTGIIRDEEGLQAGLAELDAVRNRLIDLSIEGDRTSRAFELAVDLGFRSQSPRQRFEAHSNEPNPVAHIPEQITPTPRITGE